MRLFITGATGAIGSRLVEIAAARGVEVVALVRNWSRASRIARYPVRMVGGDVLRPDSFAAELKGCDAVVHGAVDNRRIGRSHRRTSEEGTRNMALAAQEAGIRSFVHVSSVAVYSYRPGRDAETEDGTLRRSGDAYCDGKILAEQAVRDVHRTHGLPVTILRPAIVYGPFTSWTQETVAAMRNGRLVSLEGGRGICNTVYVDNLVDAILQVAAKPSTAGQAYHVGDSEPVSWGRFWEEHRRACDPPPPPLVEMMRPELEESMARGNRVSSWRRMREVWGDPVVRKALLSIPVVKGTARAFLRASSWVMSRGSHRQMVEQAVSAPPPREAPRICPRITPEEGDVFSTAVTFRIDRARRELGYDPRVDFVEGMKRTAEWIRWARL